MIDPLFLKEFREEIEAYAFDRCWPFICDGSPFNCEIFVVGYNAATTLRNNFWRYWSDEFGLDRDAFMRDFPEKNSGARPRLNEIVEGAMPEKVLETNLYFYSTAKKRQLPLEYKKHDGFEYLLFRIRPRIIFLHSDDPISFFRERCSPFNDYEFGQEVCWNHSGFCFDFRLFPVPGPLYVLGYEQAFAIGQVLAETLREVRGL
jgi:hypothetical protein